MPRKQTFKRRPNKAGTVIKLSGKRRRPWCAKVTTGKDIITGRQIQTVLGTFGTWDEADDALTLYRLGQKIRLLIRKLKHLHPIHSRSLLISVKRICLPLKKSLILYIRKNYAYYQKVLLKVIDRGLNILIVYTTTRSVK